MIDIPLRRAIRLALLWLFVPLLPAFGFADYVVQEEHDYDISATNQDTTTLYELTSSHKVRTTYLSRQSVTQRVFKVGESFFSPMRRLQAFLNDVSDRRITIKHDFEQQRDILTSDYKIHTITYPAIIKPGDIAEYTYERSYKSINYFPLISVSNWDSISTYRISIHHPKELQIDFDVWFPSHRIPFEIDSSDPQTTVLIFSKVGESALIDDLPLDHTHAYIQVIPSLQKQPIVASTPTAFARWYRSLFDQEPVVESPELEHVKKLIEPLHDDRSRLAALHDYVRKNILYIAEEHQLGAIVPRPPSTVLTRQFGDCKDRAYLIYSLARFFGIKNVYMALINTEVRPAFKGCHMWQYNHMICALEENGQVLFFDPTDTYTAFGEVPERLIERPAFVLNPDNPRHVTVQSTSSAPTLDATITASVQHPDQAHARIIVRGSNLSRAQWLLDNYTMDRVNTDMSQHIAEYFRAIAIGNLAVVMRSDTAIEFSADVDLSRFFLSSQAQVFIPSAPFPRVRNQFIDRSEDSLDISLYGCDNIALAIVLTAPGYRAEATSVSLGEGTPGSFTAAVANVEDRIEIRYRFIEKKRILSGEEKHAHMKFCVDYLQQKKTMFTLTGGTP